MGLKLCLGMFLKIFIKRVSFKKWKRKSENNFISVSNSLKIKKKTTTTTFDFISIFWLFKIVFKIILLKPWYSFPKYFVNNTKLSTTLAPSLPNLFLPEQYKHSVWTSSSLLPTNAPSTLPTSSMEPVLQAITNAFSYQPTNAAPFPWFGDDNQSVQLLYVVFFFFFFLNSFLLLVALLRGCLVNEFSLNWVEIFKFV